MKLSQGQWSCQPNQACLLGRDHRTHISPGSLLAARLYPWEHCTADIWGTWQLGILSSMRAFKTMPQYRPFSQSLLQFLCWTVCSLHGEILEVGFDQTHRNSSDLAWSSGESSRWSCQCPWQWPGGSLDRGLPNNAGLLQQGLKQVSLFAKLQNIWPKTLKLWKSRLFLVSIVLLFVEYVLAWVAGSFKRELLLLSFCVCGVNN